MMNRSIHLQEIAPMADIQKGKRLTTSVTERELRSWVTGESL